MTEDERRAHIEQHLALCKRIYLRMEQEGSWPWRDTEAGTTDSTPADDLLDSEHNSP